MHALIREIEQEQVRANPLPEFNSGDTVRVHVRVVEGNRERTQVFEGVVIRYRGGGNNKNFTVRRVANGVGVERTFLVNSPRVEKVEVVRFGKVRRAKLYYLRGLTGRAARIKERRYIPKPKGQRATDTNAGGGIVTSGIAAPAVPSFPVDDIIDGVGSVAGRRDSDGESASTSESTSDSDRTNQS